MDRRITGRRVLTSARCLRANRTIFDLVAPAGASCSKFSAGQVELNFVDHEFAESAYPVGLGFLRDVTLIGGVWAARPR